MTSPSERVNYAQLATVLLVVSESLLASMKHEGIEVDDITLELQAKESEETRKVTTTVEAILLSARMALGLPPVQVDTKEMQ